MILRLDWFDIDTSPITITFPKDAGPGPGRYGWGNLILTRNQSELDGFEDLRMALKTVFPAFVYICSKSIPQSSVKSRIVSNIETRYGC